MINYDNFSILTALIIGLIGNFHCLGMCSGIITIFSISLSKEKKHEKNIYQLYYNVGRILGYILINTIAFSIGLILIKILKIDNLNILKLFSGITLITISFYLLNIINFIKKIEHLSFKLWFHISKYTKFFFPVKNPIQAIILGIIWAHIPCGLVYSTIIWSTSSGSLFKSIILILFFGLGTLPSMLGLTLLSNNIKKIINYKIIKFIIIIFFFSFGFYDVYLYFTIKSCH
ncbi:MAG TPA: sulfite exporter TauE/SafE family protein [Candidatus Azoamicus sp. MARI]